ncbi:MAG: hypothetical protein KBT11_08500 [Treponema sp.]|nr:hypothetical protein [Candidatus Treponema equifaecale]
MKKLISFVSVIVFLFCACPAFSESSDNTYADLNPPQWLKDLRRTEIITFGSLPFVTLWTTVGYSLATGNGFRNPMDKSTDSFSQDDQFNIIKISAATCIGLGLFDLGFNLVRRSILKNKQDRRKEEAVEIYPFSTEEKEKMDLVDDLLPPEPEFFKCGVESAIF